MMTDEEIAAEIRQLIASGESRFIAAYSIPQDVRLRITLKLEAEKKGLTLFWMTDKWKAIVAREQSRRIATAIPPEMWQRLGLAAPQGLQSLTRSVSEPIAPRPQSGPKSPADQKRSEAKPSSKIPGIPSRKK